MVIGQKARPELSLCRQSQTIAPVAEMMTQRMYESDLARGAIEPITLGRTIVGRIANR